IASQGVRLLAKHGSRVDHLVAAIGPAIGSCCYPTGLEAASQLLTSLVDGLALNGDPHALMSTIKEASLEEFFLIKDDRFHPDLKAINALQLSRAGVKQVDVTNLCTSCKPELFYSHRLSQGTAGRQAAVACLN